MINDRANASDENREIEPVTMLENQCVKGHALCHEDIFQEHIERAQALRDRQAKYQDSLPSDPSEVISAALELLHHDFNLYPEGIQEALHLSQGLEALIKCGEVEEGHWDHDAAMFIASRIVQCLHDGARQLDRISDILGNPGRIERGHNNR